jgi:hypothetical protein
MVKLIFEAEIGSRWNPAMKITQRGLVYPSTGTSPGFQTSPYPAARFLAYRIEIIASSKRTK